MMQDKEPILDIKDNKYYGLSYLEPFKEYTQIIKLEIFNISVIITDQYIKTIPNKLQRFMLKWFFGIKSTILNEEKFKDAIRLSKSNNSK